MRLEGSITGNSNVVLLAIVVNSSWLAFILGVLYRRVYREEFLKYWALSLVCAAVRVGVPYVFAASPAGWQAAIHAQYLIGVMECVFVVLATAALWDPHLTRKRTVAIAAMTTVVLGCAYVGAFALSSSARNLGQALGTVNSDSMAVTLLAFSLVFGRKHRLARAAGGLLVRSGTALTALLFLLFSVPGTMRFLGPSLFWFGVPALILPITVSAGMILLAVDAIAGTNRALQESEERYRTLVEASPDAILASDLAGNFTMYNRRTYELFGCADPAELLGNPAGEVVSPVDRERVTAEMKSRISHEGVSRVECVMQRRDGSTFSAELTAAALRGHDLAVVGLIGIIRDVSEQKAAAAERAKLEARLMQAQRLDSIGRLAGGVAHDFNNHLTVINGYCDLMMRRVKEGDALRPMLQQVRDGGQRAAALTRQLLAFGRRQVLAPRPLSLNEVVSGLSNMLRRLVTENVDIVTRLGPDLGTVMADLAQIEQVVLNLVVNARDAMPEGGRLTIETANMDGDGVRTDSQAQLPEGPCVMLAVSDTGIGMNEETKRLIFEPFFTTKEQGKGTGLGLATVYGIVQQSGGSVWVYSEPGKGSTFRVYLPRVDAEATPAQHPADAPDNSVGHETILLVEDQSAVRELIAEALQERGYKVLQAPDGPTALSLPEADLRAIDLLVTDVVMPQMSGLELADRLGAMRPETRVLFISGYSESVLNQERILKDGAAYLAKPFSPAQVAAKVREILSRSAG